MNHGAGQAELHPGPGPRGAGCQAADGTAHSLPSAGQGRTGAGRRGGSECQRAGGRVKRLLRDSGRSSLCLPPLPGGRGQ